MKKKFFILVNILFVVTTGMMAFSCEDGDSVLEKTQNQNGSSKKVIRLLSIGNSYSSDALMYVPFILRNMGINADIQMGLLIQSGSSLKKHVDNFNSEAPNYSFHLHTGESSWSSMSNKTIQYALSYQWDYVILQQVSGSSTDWSTYQPYLNQLIEHINEYTRSQVKFGWYTVQSKPAATINGANWDDNTILLNYENIIENAKRVLNETACEFVIPVGTAIQNARTITAIKQLGDYTNNPLNTSNCGYLTYDGTHLQEGLPSQIAAYTFVLSILELYGFSDYSIIGESTRVTSKWEKGKKIVGRNGAPIGSNAENCLIAQKCVIMAMQHPFEVTDMNYLINTNNEK